MRTKALRIAAATALTVALWVVPSAVTQGQGTIGDRFDHVDRRVFGGTPVDRAALAAGDTTTASAVVAL